MPPIEEDIFNLARAEGFDAAGICSAGPFGPQEKTRFREWLKGGNNAQMAWFEREADRRFEPSSLLEDAKSAIVFRANFFRRGGDGRIALYAQSEDYHTVLRRKMAKVVSPLEAAGGRQKICIDTSPLAEKLLALRAGLGWIGRNTLIITKQNGPWSFLGVILTTLELEHCGYGLEKGSCGGCRKCVDACPTQALGKNGLDARKCISYLSIEKRRDRLSQEELSLIGNRLFGCDECLKACPFGKAAPSSNMGEFLETISLPEDASFESLKNISEGTPISRAFRFEKSRKTRPRG